MSTKNILFAVYAYSFLAKLYAPSTMILNYIKISISSIYTRLYYSSIQNQQIMYVWLQTRDSITDKSAPEFSKSIYLTICSAYLSYIRTSILYHICKQNERIVLDFIEFSTEPISFMDTPIVQSARENSEALITCMVKGDPEPSVSWYYNGQLLNGMYILITYLHKYWSWY